MNELRPLSLREKRAWGYFLSAWVSAFIAYLVFEFKQFDYLFFLIIFMISYVIGDAVRTLLIPEVKGKPVPRFSADKRLPWQFTWFVVGIFVGGALSAAFALKFQNSPYFTSIYIGLGFTVIPIMFLWFDIKYLWRSEPQTFHGKAEQSMKIDKISAIIGAIALIILCALLFYFRFFSLSDISSALANFLVLAIPALLLWGFRDRIERSLRGHADVIVQASSIRHYRYPLLACSQTTQRQMPNKELL